MENTVLSAAEIVEYGEFKRTRREAEVALTLRRLVVDASRRETDKYSLKSACDCAKKLNCAGVLVSPVNVTAARRLLEGSETLVFCLVGGTGESLAAVKKAEAKRAARQGAKEIRLVLCYSALTGGNAAYLKREIKRVKRAVKKCALTVSLEDHSLGEEEVARGVRAACEGKADGVCVRGETALLLRAVKAGAGRLRAECSGVENAEQLRFLLKSGAARASTQSGEKIAEQLYREAEEGGTVVTVPAPKAEEKDPAPEE